MFVYVYVYVYVCVYLWLCVCTLSRRTILHMTAYILPIFNFTFFHCLHFVCLSSSLSISLCLSSSLTLSFSRCLCLSLSVYAISLWLVDSANVFSLHLIKLKFDARGRAVRWVWLNCVLTKIKSGIKQKTSKTEKKTEKNALNKNVICNQT